VDGAELLRPPSEPTGGASPLRAAIARRDSIVLVKGARQMGKTSLLARSLQQARDYTFSVVEASMSLHKGIFPDAPRGWRAGSDRPFLIAGVRKDSDEVYQAALKKAAEYDKQHPGMTVSYLLGMNSTYPDATWRVVWGESVSSSSFSVLIDAASGAFVETLR